VRDARDAGLIRVAGPERGALISWGLIHGLTSLYLSGHLAHTVGTHEDFLQLVEEAMDTMRTGWGPPAPS
jgi:hypothetical protein